MISLDALSDRSAILDLKAQYLESLVAPMDGTWEIDVIDAASHCQITWGGERAGYYAANDEGDLLQFYVMPVFEHQGRAIFDHVVAQDALTTAVVSTIDPLYLSLCLDLQHEVVVHTFLYESQTVVRPDHPEAHRVKVHPVEASTTGGILALEPACLGGAQDLSRWLPGYSTDLIDRGELFVLCLDNEMLGFGERRRSDSQEGIADVGMMVLPEHRGKGWATYLMSWLNTLCESEGLHAICSTNVDNIAAQKAITRSGFVSRHRIMDVAL